MAARVARDCGAGELAWLAMLLARAHIAQQRFREIARVSAQNTKRKQVLLCGLLNLVHGAKTNRLLSHPNKFCTFKYVDCNLTLTE
jgi:hypothetical protein